MQGNTRLFRTLQDCTEGYRKKVNKKGSWRSIQDKTRPYKGQYRTKQDQTRLYTTIQIPYKTRMIQEQARLYRT